MLLSHSPIKNSLCLLFALIHQWLASTTLYNSMWFAAEICPSILPTLSNDESAAGLYCRTIWSILSEMRGKTTNNYMYGMFSTVSAHSNQKNI